jgi:Cep192 domain 4/Abnormal spindle-like microcephaly-assoc'd, ASPM-SPD-2-Hydin
MRPFATYPELTSIMQSGFATFISDVADWCWFYMSDFDQPMHRYRRFNPCWQALAIVLTLASLTGCQGVSGASPSNQQPAQTGTLALDTPSLSFGSVLIGHSSSLSVRASNSGTASLTISAAQASAPEFSQSAPALPLTVAAGQSVTLSVTFSPSAAGDVTGTISIVSNASNGAVSMSLSGIGVAPGSITANPASLAFGSVALGNSQQESSTLTNNGGTSVTISQAAISGAGFTLSGLASPVTLSAGQSANFTVTFAPQSADSVTGNVTITSNAPNPTLTVPLSGTGSASSGSLSANPTSLSFGSVQVGNSQTLSEVLTNTGGSNVVISQDTISGSGFSVSGFTSPLTLTPGQKYSFSAIFAPQSAGSAAGSISIVSNASNPSLAIPLSGTATAAGQLAVAPTTLNFYSVVVGTNASLSASLVATGSSVTVTSFNSSNSEFTQTDLSLPVTVQPGNSVPFTVKFTPQTTGTANGTFTFVSNAPNGPTVQSLTGTGTAPPIHSVALSWKASTSPNISSYNIYRSTTSGSFSPPAIASVSAPTITYTDNSVTDGLTYYYAITAVNSSNQESAYSAQASATIPPP